MRRAHYLKTVKGGTIPRSILCAAVVSDGEEKLVWATAHLLTDNATAAEFDNSYGVGAPSFWLTVQATIKAYPGTWIVFLGACEQLTMLGFWELLEEDKWSLCDDTGESEGKKPAPAPAVFSGVAVLEDPPTVIVARQNSCKRVAKFVDLRNYGVGGWDSVYGAPMPQGDCAAAAQAKSTALACCLRTLTGLVGKYNLGSLKTTAASQAMHAYRHRFLKSLVLVHDNLPALGLERAAMYAGRNECWTLGTVPGGVYHLDFNQFYPACVMGEPMPARLAGFELGCKPHPQELMDRGFLVIAEVGLDADEPRYPVRFTRTRHARWQLPYPDANPKGYPRDDDLVYPVGRFHTALCGPELSVALRHQEVSRVHSVAWYEPSELFTQWASELAFMEEEAKSLHCRGVQEWVKRVRNSLFGKFGQWAWRWSDKTDVRLDGPYDLQYRKDKRSGAWLRHRSIAWKNQVEERLGESPESCPAISAWVYSLARARLWRAIEVAGRQNVHYMDTDSLWCNHKGFLALQAAGMIHQSMPGYLKIKGMHDAVAFHGLKTYTVGGREVHAGIPDNATGNHAEGWRFTGPEKLMPALAQGRAPAVRQIRYKVKASGVYRHGIRTVSGRVLPFTFNEE